MAGGEAMSATPLTDGLPLFDAEEYLRTHVCCNYQLALVSDVRGMVELPLRAEIAALTADRDRYLADLRRVREAVDRAFDCLCADDEPAALLILSAINKESMP
jgi:hypothetical protein